MIREVCFRARTTRPTAKPCSTVETTSAEGCQPEGGASEKSVVMREDAMPRETSLLRLDTNWITSLVTLNQQFSDQPVRP